MYKVWLHRKYNNQTILLCSAASSSGAPSTYHVPPATSFIAPVPATYPVSPVSVSVYLVLFGDIKITADYRSIYKLGVTYN